MPDMSGADEAFSRGREFRLGAWIVRPLQNRLSNSERTVQVEPKMIDVLVLLAEHAGAVVSRSMIEERVWKGVFVTDSVVTRAIAGLRRALGDAADAPRYIETIPRRGYRLLVPVAPIDTAAGAPHLDQPRQPAVGRLARGAAFVGRAKQLAEILDGPRNTLWLMGGRAVGKTSLLRQVELLAREPARAELPLYWDLQGAATPDDLTAGLADALLDAHEQFAVAGVDLAAMIEGTPAMDAAARIAALRRATARAGRRLLLLCDEAEALIGIGAAEPAFLGRLRRVLQSHDDLRSVLAATGRLWLLAEPLGDTSPFLHGFAPPLRLGMLEDDEAEALLVSCVGAAIPAPAVAAVCRACGNHPALLQFAAAQLAETDDVDAALARVASEESVRLLFEADWSVYGAAEREVLSALAAGQPVPDTVPARAARHALEGLRVLRSGDEGPALAGSILGAWLRARA
jgi:DNA-binding winged helix-turn-helix (wHTH) protein